MKTNQKSPTLASNLFQQEYTETIVANWDDYIDWERRKETENGFFSDILSQHGAQRVLDVACGTGYHTVTLANDGFCVTGADGSRNMVAKARENAVNAGLTGVPFHTVSWDQLTSVFADESFDAVLCLGNSFTHLFQEEDRLAALREMYSLLKPGGIALIDQRNYDALLDRGHEGEHSTYYLGESVNVEKVAAADDSIEFKFEYADGSTGRLTTCPIRQEYVSALLARVGFQHEDRYGDFEADYDFYAPEFIIHMARK